MTQPYSFTKDGARRIVDAVRTVEGNDPRYAGPKRRRRPTGSGPEAFIVARVTAIDTGSTPLTASAIEQFWSDEDGDMADLPSGRVWNGQDGNLPKLTLIDGQHRNVGDIVTVGVKYGADDAYIWFAQPEMPVETGFGKPTMSQDDLPVTNTIELTVTNAQGLPILDSEGSEQEITVYRNTLRKSLYTDFLDDDVFMYVKFRPNYQGVEGCIFSRTEAFRTNADYVPDGGIQLGGSEVEPLATDETGDPGDASHVFVTGAMYYDKSGGTHGEWVPWFSVDPEAFGGFKVKTDGDDTTAGFLDDEIIVDPGGGAEFWLQKTVDPGGAADNKLLLEHKDQQASVISLTPMSSLSEPVDGTVRINSASVPVDDKGHVVDADSVANTHDIIFTATSPLTRSTSAALGDVTVTYGIDFTAISGYSGSARQVLVNNAGTIQWETVAEITVVDDVTYDTSTGNLEQDKLTTVEVISGGVNSDNNLIEQAEDC
ncbi:MAG: hypothetical protein EBY40_00230 [Marivivens sp.]|nr:hypothetical protein [Marivivens sp.]NBT50017.1 hypothetical protein [Marivivens sp.]NCW67035.1 hypothetical protein [Marivivens sp.]NDH01536.1 hypothetical protein [Marivivens sp.]